MPDPGGVIAAVERMLLSDETVRVSVPGTAAFDERRPVRSRPARSAVRGRARTGRRLGRAWCGQPYKDDGDGRYRLFTPLSAPVAPEAAEVAIVTSVDGAAAGRVFTVLDLGETGTHSVVRVTWMRITKAGAAA